MAGLFYGSVHLQDHQPGEPCPEPRHRGDGVPKPGNAPGSRQALREANVYEPHFYRHLLSGTRILGCDGNAWQAETSYTVIRTMQEGDMSVFSTGKYVDEIVLDADRPRFRSRIVVTDSMRVHTLVVIPL